MKTALRVFFSVCLLGAIVWMLGGVREVGSQILRMNPLYIIAVVALTMFDRGVMAYKWCLLLGGRGIRFPFVDAMKLYCAAAIWGLFLPTTVGSDAVRAYSTARTSAIDPKDIVASIVVERVGGFLAALVLAVASLGLVTQLGYLGDRVVFAWVLGAGVLLATVALFAVSVSDGAFHLIHDKVLRRFQANRITQKLRQFHDAYRSFATDRRSVGTFFGLTLGEQLLPIVDTWLVAKGLGIEVGVLYLAAAMPLALLVSRFPVSIDGLGVFEGVFILMMSLAGLSTVDAAAIAIASRILGTISYLPWWFAYMISARNLRATRASQ